MQGGFWLKITLAVSIYLIVKESKIALAIVLFILGAG